MITALQILIWLFIIGPAVPLAYLYRMGGGLFRRLALVGLSLSLIWLVCSVAVGNPEQREGDSGVNVKMVPG